MYLSLGKNKVEYSDNIIGIFDLDITSQSIITREYLSKGEKAGKVCNVAEDLPKTFVVCFEENKETIYLSQTATATLCRRAEKENI